MIKHIPNTITLGNVLAGCAGIIFATQGNFELVGLCVLIALVCDFADGFVARALNASSPIGKDLDSLADMVTFGVLPSIVMYHFLKEISCDPKICTGLINREYLPFISFSTAAFSALRLAKFNNDTRQTDKFIGLPTPANAALLISIALIPSYAPEFSWMLNPRIVAVLIIISSYLLVAELPLIALKFNDFSLKGNFLRYLLIVLSIVLILLFKIVSVPLIVLIYIFLSVIENLLEKKNNMSV